MVHHSFLVRCSAVLLILAGCSEPSLPCVKPWSLEVKAHFAAKSVLCCKKVATLVKDHQIPQNGPLQLDFLHKYNEEWLVVLQSQLIIIS